MNLLSYVLGRTVTQITPLWICKIPWRHYNHNIICLDHSNGISVEVSFTKPQEFPSALCWDLLNMS